jgi:hypothetical protein
LLFEEKNVGDSASQPSDSSAAAGRQAPERVSADIERLIRSEVASQMTKEIGLLKESVALSIKILGAAFALLLAIFTVFGLTTWRDIKEETGQLVKKQAEELIQKADADTSVKATLNDMLNRTVLSSYLAAKMKNPGRTIELAQNEWDRIRAWIKNEDLPLQEFSDALALLNLQKEERRRSDASRLIADMLNPPATSPYRWMVKQPEKVEAILRIFKHQALGAAAVEVVASRPLPDSVRGAAAAYVQEVGYADGAARLFSIYQSLPPGEARKNALIACAALRPGDPAVMAELNRLIGEPTGKEKTNIVVGVINILPDIKPRSSSSESRNEFNRISNKLLRYAADQGLFFELVYIDQPSPTFEQRLNDVDNDDKSLSRQFMQAPPSIQAMIAQDDGAALPAGTMSVPALKRFDTYWALLGSYADAGDMKQFRPLLLRSNTNRRGNQPRIRVAVSADPDAAMSVNSDQGPPATLSFKSIRKAYVSSTEGWSKPEDIRINLAWVDDTGEHTGEVIGFKGKGYRFSLDDTRAQE